MKLIVFGHPDLLDKDTLGSHAHLSLKSLAVYFDFKFDPAEAFWSALCSINKANLTSFCPK